MEGTGSCSQLEAPKHQELDYLGKGHQLFLLVFNNASAGWQFPLHHGAQFPKCAARLFDIYREIGKYC